jgi:hypothetical protein
VAGVAFAQRPVIAVEDAGANVVTTDSTTQVTIALTIPNGGTLGGMTTQIVSGGFASFGPSINKTGTYTLTATGSPSLTPAVSGTIAVQPAAAATLQLTALSAGTAGVAQTATVTALDAFSNTATGYAGTVHFTSTDGQAVLPADYHFTVGAGNDNGIHTFTTGITLKTAGSKTVTATDTVTSAITGSQTVVISPAAATTLQLTGLGVGTAGNAQTATVTALDAFNNTATAYTGTVHFTSTDGQALVPADYHFTVGLGSDNGVHTFASGVTLKTAGSQTVTATDTVSSTITGGQTMTIGPAAAATLQVSGLSASTAGVAQTASVTAKDTYGNLASSYTGAVHFTTTDGQATVPADYHFTVGGGLDNGTHTFIVGVTLKTAGPQTVTATDTVSSTITGNQTVTISPAAAATLQVTGLSAGTAGVAQTSSVTAKDTYGNTATGYTGTVHFTTTDGQATVPADYHFAVGSGLDNGTHTFIGGVTLKTTGSQTVTTTDTLANTITGSQTVTISPTAGAKLLFTVQPSGTANAGVAFAQQPGVSVEDAFGNVVTNDNTTLVGLALTTPGGATLAGTANQTASSGVATFSALSINKTGSYTLTATSSPVLTSAVSSTVTIQPGAATQLVFTTQPSSTQSTAGITPAVTVSVEDSLNNLVTSDTRTITVSLASNAPGGTLSGTLSQAASAGVASFGGLSIDKVGSYTLAAGGGGLSAPGSNAFSITLGPATQLLFTTQPSSAATAGIAFTQQPGVGIEDAGGNVVTTDSATSVSLSLTTPNGAVLSGTNAQTAASGVATFNGLSVNKTGSYTMTATSTPGLTPAVSTIVMIQPGAATKLVFTTQPGTALSTAVITPAVRVAVEDSLNNVVTGDSSGVTVSLASNVTGGALSGTLSQAAGAGIATFNDLAIDKVGSYTLGASDGALTSATSTSFSITLGPATQLAFTTQPSSTTAAGVAFTQQPGASVEDAGGNVVAADSTTHITVALTSANGAVLSGTTTLTAAGGVASFSGLSVNKTGSYTLTATSTPVLTSAVSNSFAITPAAASQLVFTTQPSSTSTAGVAFAQQPGVSVEDAFGNAVTTDSTTSVSLALTTPGGAILAGTTSQTASSGVATFSGLSVNKTGSYTLTATSAPVLPSAVSNSLTIQPGAATKLAFVQQPAAAQATVAIAPAVTVAVEDTFANVVTSDTRTITVSLASNLTSGTLSGTLSQTASAGVASFGDLSVDKVGSYALGASGGGLTGPSSSSFSITPGQATQLVFTTQPSSTATHGVALGQQPAVSVEDASGNVVTTDNTTVVTLGLAGGELGAKLTCTTVPPQVTSGVATFAGCSIDLASLTPYQVTASGSTSATAGPFPSTNVTVS